jgi:hypothetical protein
MFAPILPSPIIAICMQIESDRPEDASRANRERKQTRTANHKWTNDEGGDLALWKSIRRGRVGHGKNCDEEKHKIEIQGGAQAENHEIEVIREDGEIQVRWQARLEERRRGESRGIDCQRGRKRDACAREKEALAVCPRRDFENELRIESVSTRLMTAWFPASAFCRAHCARP